MLVFDGYSHGSPCWIELSAPDPQLAHSFYGALFGWEFEDAADLFGEGHTVATLRGRRVAGIVAGPGGLRSGWTSYFAARDLDAAIRRVEQEGGEAARAPRPVGSAGRAALARDPAGNLFGLWQKGEVAGAELVREPGAFTWVRLATGQVAAVKEFYCVLFGYDTSLLPVTRNFPAYAFAIDFDLVASMAPREACPGLEPQWLPYFTVVDLALAAGAAERLGGSAVEPDYKLPGLGQFQVFQDPQGAAFMLWQPHAMEMLGS